MKKSFLALCLFTACASGHHVMTMESFAEIPVGYTESEIVSTVGKPYATHRKEDGAIEYEYIERLNAGSRSLEERHYYILIKDGRVVSKRVEKVTPPGYGFDSYEMQTTQSSKNL